MYTQTIIKYLKYYWNLKCTRICKFILTLFCSLSIFFKQSMSKLYFIYCCLIKMFTSKEAYKFRFILYFFLLNFKNLPRIRFCVSYLNFYFIYLNNIQYFNFIYILFFLQIVRILSVCACICAQIKLLTSSTITY